MDPYIILYVLFFLIGVFIGFVMGRGTCEGLHKDMQDAQSESGTILGFFGGGLIVAIVVSIISPKLASFLLGGLLGVGLRLILTKNVTKEENDKMIFRVSIILVLIIALFIVWAASLPVESPNENKSNLVIKTEDERNEEIFKNFKNTSSDDLIFVLNLALKEQGKWKANMGQSNCLRFNSLFGSEQGVEITGYMPQDSNGTNFVKSEKVLSEKYWVRIREGGHICGSGDIVIKSRIYDNIEGIDLWIEIKL